DVYVRSCEVLVLTAGDRGGDGEDGGADRRQSLRGGRFVCPLGGGDQLAHGGLVAGAQQRDRVGIAVDDALEEDLAVLVGRERALRPAADLVEQHGEPRV